MTRVRYGVPVGRGRRTAQPAISRVASDSTPVAAALFVDHSNIWLGMRRSAEAQYEPGVSLEFGALLRLLAAGRAVVAAALVIDAETPGPVQSAMRAAGFEVIARERGRLTGSEQANDETLAVRLYETVASREPGVVVLATGDGAGSHQDRGFVPALRNARAHGWGIEVAAWDDSLNARLRQAVNAEGGAVVSLDDYYYGITRVPGLRGPSAVSLCHRSTADRTVRTPDSFCRSSLPLKPTDVITSAA